MIIQASVWSVPCGSHRLVPGSGAITCRTEAKKAPMIRTQSRQKKTIMASAVATCSPTMYARYGDSALETSRSCAHCPPMMRRDEHGVAQAGHREQFGDSLQQPDDPGLCERQMRHASPSLPRLLKTIYPNGQWCGLHEHVHPTQGGASGRPPGHQSS